MTLRIDLNCVSSRLHRYITMAFSDQTPTLLAGIPPALPRQDRALSWACSVCFHTLALAVAAVALRGLPPAQAPVYRMEILLSDTQSEVDQAAPSDSQAEAGSARDQEIADLLEDSSRVLASLSPPVRSASEAVVKQQPLSESPVDPRPAQHTTPAAAAPEATAVASTSGDPFPVERSTPIERRTETLDSGNEPDRPSPRPSETIEQAKTATATSSAQEPPAKNFDNHVETSPQREASSSPPADPAPIVDSQTGSSGSPTASSAETVALNHPTMTRTGPAKSQYGWLAELLRRRTMSLLAYPHLARIQGLEGIVVVRTTINSDGSLVDAVVTKSSGYGALDEDALKLMHRVCPIRLPQDLGKSQIAVLIPIRYRLDRLE